MHNKKAKFFYSEKIRKNSEKLRKIRKNSEKFGKIQKNSEKFRKIWKNSGKIGEQNIKSGEISGVWRLRVLRVRGPREGGSHLWPRGVHTYPTYPQLTARRGCSQKIFQGGCSPIFSSEGGVQTVIQ